MSQEQSLPRRRTGDPGTRRRSRAGRRLRQPRDPHLHAGPASGVLRPATAVAGGQPRRRRLPQRLGALGPRLRPFAGTDPPAHRQPAASGRSAGGQSRGRHPPRHPRPGMADPPPQPHEWTGPGAGRKGFHGRRRAVLRQLSQVHPGAQPSARLQDRKSRVAGRRTRSALAVAGLAAHAVHRQPACRPTQGRRRRLPSGRAAGFSPARRGWPPVVARLRRQPPVQPSATCSRSLAAASCSSISTTATCCTCTPRPSCSGRVRSHPSPGPPAPSACWRCAAGWRWRAAPAAGIRRAPAIPFSSCR